MEECLLMEEEEEIKRIKSSVQKKSVCDLNRKNLSDDDLDEIFCEF